MLSGNSETVIDDKRKAEVLNSFFHSSPENLVTLNLSNCPEELLCTEEVSSLLCILDITKSNDPDGISARMLKGVACSLAPGPVVF